MNSIDVGSQVLGSLMKSLETDFTESQAASITTAVLYSVAFRDSIKQYWDAHAEEMLREILTRGNGSIGD